MIDTITINSFKSLEEVTVPLGIINIFIGANGSGKSNFLEALGVLSAAADGRVNDAALMMRGVRPGLPTLYKSAFPRHQHIKQPTTIDIEAKGADQSVYKVCLYNPIGRPSASWRYHSEKWTAENGELIVGRSNRSTVKYNPEMGLAALKTVERSADDPSTFFLEAIKAYRIFSPDTPTLRGLSNERFPQRPLGLSGGGLPSALQEMQKTGRDHENISSAFEEVYELIEWARKVEWATSSSVPLSPSAAVTKDIVKFTDRFMVSERNILSGADASEGALYVLFSLVLALDPRSPSILSIDNADHGLNPRLARRLMKNMCTWILGNSRPRRLIMTTHNPMALDGLPLQDDRVRLFTVGRTHAGKTAIRRIELDHKLLKALEKENALSRLWVMGHLGGVPNV